MKTITKIPETTVAALHHALCDEYGCRQGEIVCIMDTEAKKMAVFILTVYHYACARSLSDKYLINALYVPTVVKTIVEAYVVDTQVQQRVVRILDKMDLYGC